MARTSLSVLIPVLSAMGCVQQSAFQPIFNGTDLTGFAAVGPASWAVEEGAIVGHQDAKEPGGGYLVTKHIFHDFELVFEFRIVPHNGNSGIVIRDPTGGQGVTARNGYEIQILDQPDVAYPTGSIYGIAPGLDPEQNADWNRMRVVAYREWLRVDLNGKKVSETKVPRAPSAPLMFQCYGGRANRLTRVSFRNIVVRPLYFAPEEFADKFTTREGADDETGEEEEAEGAPVPPERVEVPPAPPEPPDEEPATPPAPPPAPAEQPKPETPPPPETEKPPAPPPEEKPKEAQPASPPAPPPAEKPAEQPATPPAPAEQPKPETPPPPETEKPPAPPPEEKPKEAQPAPPIPPPPGG